MKNNLLSEKSLFTQGTAYTPTHLHLCTYNATGDAGKFR